MLRIPERSGAVLLSCLVSSVHHLTKTLRQGRPNQLQTSSRIPELMNNHAQPAFHPNATQFTLHVGDKLFGFRRQSLDCNQSLFCIHNLTDEDQVLPLSRLNLALADPWRELISETRINGSIRDWVLSPYQTLWITNA